MAQYNANSVHITYAGNFIQGFVTNSLITIIPPIKKIRKKVGVMGDVARSIQHLTDYTEVNFSINSTCNPNSYSLLQQVYNNRTNGNLIIQYIDGTKIFSSENAQVDSCNNGNVVIHCY